MAKNTTQGKDPEIKETPQNTPDTENQGTTPEAETPKGKGESKPKGKGESKPKGKGESKPKGKVYKFVSDNKFLTCSSVGVQFINGKAETSSLEVAKVLATLSGVTLVED